MLQRAGLLLLAVTTAALTGACSATGPAPAAAGSAPAGSASAAVPTTAPVAGSTAEPTPTPTPTPKPTPTPTRTRTTRPAAPVGDPGDGDMLAGLGTGAKWATYLKRCPDSRQKMLIQKVITADVDGDGTDDAVVGHACSPVTSYWPSEVDVFDGASSSRKPKRLGGTLLAEVGATDRPYLDGLQVRNGTVVIKAYGVDEHTEPTCPSIYRTYRYQLTGGEFRRTARDAANAGRCPDLSN